MSSATNEILVVLRNLNEVSQTIQSSRRVKYGCIEVSSSFICIGASTGTTYVFDRTTCKLLRFISNKVSNVTQLKFSSDEKILAVAQSSGLITCWEFENASEEVKIVKEVDDFIDHAITALCWSDVSPRLFVGSRQGLVMAFNIGFVSLSLASVEMIRKCEEPIVQLDVCREKLLISSTSKSMLCFTDRGKFQQIGRRARDGMYGTCFLKNNDELVIYSARPGSRLWEVDSTGQVLATHQFRELLNISPLAIITTSKVDLPASDPSQSSNPQSFNFPFLHRVMDKYLMTVLPHGIYFFEPCTGNVLMWNDQIKDVTDVCCHDNTTYILHSNSSVTELLLLTTKQCLQRLYSLKEWQKVAQVACSHIDEILTNVESFLSIDFYDVKDNLDKEDKWCQPLEALISEFEKKHAEVKAIILARLNTDIEIQTASSTDTDDYEDSRSVFSESSSKGSLSRLVNLDNIMEKASNLLVNKVVTKGFMKKAFFEALQAEGVNMEVKKKAKLAKTSSVPTSPIHFRKGLQNKIAKSSDDLTEVQAPVQQQNSVPDIPNKTVMVVDDVIVHRSKRTKSRKKKRGKADSISKKKVEMADQSQHADTEKHRFKADYLSATLPSNTAQLINKLISITAQTRNDLRDTKVLYNAKVLREVLSEWSRQFSGILEQFTEGYYKQLNEKLQLPALLPFVKLEASLTFFRQLSASFNEVSNVAMLCLETGIFPESCKTMSKHETSLLNFQLDFDGICEQASSIINQIDAVVATDESECDRLSLSTIASESEFEQPRPFLCDGTLLDAGNCCPCMLDTCRAVFVLRYFPILNFSRLRQVLMVKGGCCWRTWCACMLHLKDIHKHGNLWQILQKSGESELLDMQTFPLEEFLANAPRLNSEKISQYVKESSLTDWEVTLLYNTGYIPSDGFLDYIKENLSDSKKHSPIFLLCALFVSLKQQPAVSELICECGKARPGSNNVHWHNNDLLTRIIANIDSLSPYQFSSCTYRIIIKKMCQSFANYGYWTGYIHLLLKTNEIKRSLELLLQLCDERLFRHHLENGCLLMTEDLWKFALLALMEDTEKCCVQHESLVDPLTMERMAVYAAESIGAKNLLKILKESKIKVSLALHTNLLRALEMENKQKDVMRRLMNVASTKVWSDNPSLIHTQLEQLKERELQGNDSSFQLAELVSELLIVQDSASVWGRSFNLSDSSCPVCLLSLCIKSTSTATAGLLVFPCGHVYHKICVPQQACLICFNENFSSIY